MSPESTPLLPFTSTPWPPTFFWRCGVILVSTSIMLGAFGTHVLKGRQGITPDGIQTWSMAANYGILNGLGLMLVSVHPRFSTHRFPGYAILGGGLLFSGSIMALVLGNRPKLLGPITPLGGIVMTAGYIAMAF